MGASVVALALVAPWLVWLPFIDAPASVVLTGAVAIVGALHGWGRLVARLANRSDVDASLAMQWGVAGVLAVAGVMLVLRIYDARLLLIVGAGLHSADLALRFSTVRDQVASAWSWRRARFWIVPTILVAVIALIHVLGAAGQVAERRFDDETNVIAQLERLATTGALADWIGYPRHDQLGGHVTLAALTSGFGDAQLGRLVDRGIGLLLFLLLICARLRPRDAGSAIWSSLLIVVAASFTLKTPDLVPLWIPAGLILGLHITVATSGRSSRELLPIGLLAGGLWVVRCELAPIGLAMIALTWWSGRQSWAHDARRIAVLLAGLAFVVVSYELAERISAVAIDARAHVLLAPRTWPLVARFALFAVLVCALAPLLFLALRELDDPPLRWLAISISTGIAAIASRLWGTPPASTQIVWPIALAGIAALAIALAAQTVLRRVTMVVTLVACILVHEAQTAPGRRGWAWRYYDLLFDVQHARDRAAQPRVYDAVLASVPAGERVAVWVSRPELLDYTQHEVVDLRTPITARSKRLADLVRASRARWLLVDQDSHSLFTGLLANAHVIANTPDLQLVELR